ncbi:hypothetical protein [Streptomyces sp. BPTC-684]|uniref:hypothetical protein n=1 Tax=Streptomyces sp. BPTC-684 TaxID=3043734 RepID=UPI0024B0A826|nr:hypothetical protein [Streptomyces sp. BPTC-684]WHM37026.1 hypothetical protein QIY60_09045 [Streptomyces sp. BPTC-684]
MSAPQPVRQRLTLIKVGTTVYDTATNRTGRVMDLLWSSRVVLRPLKGGTEWWAHSRILRPHTHHTKGN